MSGSRRRGGFGTRITLWVVLITGLHLWLNVNWAVALNDLLPAAKRRPNVAYIPVTCHLACPVTDYITNFTDSAPF